MAINARTASRRVLRAMPSCSASSFSTGSFWPGRNSPSTIICLIVSIAVSMTPTTPSLLPGPLRAIRVAVGADGIGVHAGAVARLLRQAVASPLHPDRVGEVLVQVVDVLQHPAFEAAAHADVVDHRQVLDDLAQADSPAWGRPARRTWRPSAGWG